MADKKPQSEQKFYGVYIKSLLNTKVLLAINEIGQNIRQNLEKKIAAKVEGKCGIDGFIQPKSVSVKTYSNGLVNTGYVEFQVVFECMICRPVEGMLIECVAKTITKAGIHAEVVGKHGEVPITAHIARDHNYNDARFSDVKEKDVIRVRVIGVRFELNDPCIDVIGKVVERREGPAKKQRLKIGGEYLEDPVAAGGDIEELEYNSDAVSTDDES
uniref:S1 motif domain-containing protein n=1 Tax=viral metagenome TaxID=1070528 RepID=A0A6C0HIH0_9ZZZZ